MPHGRPRELHFPAGQALFHSHLPDGQEIRQDLPSPSKFESNLSQGQAGIHVFFSRPSFRPMGFHLTPKNGYSINPANTTSK